MTFRRKRHARQQISISSISSRATVSRKKCHRAKKKQSRARFSRVLVRAEPIRSVCGIQGWTPRSKPCHGLCQGCVRDDGFLHRVGTPRTAFLRTKMRFAIRDKKQVDDAIHSSSSLFVPIVAFFCTDTGVNTKVSVKNNFSLPNLTPCQNEKTK